MAQRVFPLFVPITALDRFSAPLAKMGGALEGLGKKATSAGRKLTVGLTVPLVALGTLSVRAGLDYQRSLNKVQAITGATAEQIEALAASAEATLGAEGIPSSARQTAGAMAELARGGRALADVQAMLPDVVELATATLVDEAVAAKATTDVLDAYRLSSSKAGEVTDLLAFAANRGEQEIAGLVEGVTSAAATAREFGQSLPSTVAVLNTLADAHFEGATGAALYRRAIATLANPVGKTAQKLLDLRITAKDLFRDDGQLRDLSDILETLNRHGADARDALELFGTKAGPALASLLGKGTAQTTEFRHELEKAGGAAENLAKVQLGGGVATLKDFSAKWERFLITVARSGLLEGLGAVAEALGNVLGFFLKLPEPVRRTVVAVGVAAAALGPFLIGLGSVLRLAGLVTAGLGSLTSAAAGAARIAGTVVGRLGASRLGGMLGLKLAAGAVFKETSGVEAARAAGSAAVQRVLGKKRLDAAASAGAGRARADVSGAVKVEFSNTPAGTRVRAEQRGDVPLEVDTGYVLAGGLAG